MAGGMRFFKNRPLVEMAGRGTKKSHVSFFSAEASREKISREIFSREGPVGEKGVPGGRIVA